MAVPPKHHEKRSHRNQVIKFLIIRTIGNFLILFTVFGLASTFGPALYFEIRYEVDKLVSHTYTIAQNVPEDQSELDKIMRNAQMTKAEPNLFNQVLSGKREDILFPQDPAFSVIIPKIGANEKIVANVNPDDEKAYLEVLRTSIAHAKGTAYPGLGGTTYLFAHSTDNFWNVGRYNAVFYLLNKMERGDDVVLYFQNKRFNYTVVDSKIIDAEDTHYLDSSLGQGERVVLQTCWPPGTAWKRLLVFAEPKK